MPPKPISPPPRVGILGLPFLPPPRAGAAGGKGGALRDCAALEALRLGGGLRAMLFLLPIARFWFLRDFMQIAWGYRFGDLAGCGFRRATTFLHPARGSEEPLLGFGDRVAFDCASRLTGHVLFKKHTGP